MTEEDRAKAAELLDRPFVSLTAREAMWLFSMLDDYEDDMVALLGLPAKP